ncbi:MAG: ABC transporter permease [Desulfobacteraceae bacterium]
MEFLTQGFSDAFRILFTGDPEAFSAVYATVTVSSFSVLCSAIAGFPLGFALGFYNFPGKKTLRLLSDTLLSLPTVFVGLVVYALITSRGPLGSFNLLFTLKGIGIGQFILSFPIIVSLSASAVESGEESLALTLKSLGAEKINFFLSYLWEIRHGLLTAFLTAYGRILTEVGVSMMVGGNIKWKTRTVTTAIALETGKGYFETGIALGCILLFIALFVNVSLVFLRKR